MIHQKGQFCIVNILWTSHVLMKATFFKKGYHQIMRNINKLFTNYFFIPEGKEHVALCPIFLCDLDSEIVWLAAHPPPLLSHNATNKGPNTYVVNTGWQCLSLALGACPRQAPSPGFHGKGACTVGLQERCIQTITTSDIVLPAHLHCRNEWCCVTLLPIQATNDSGWPGGGSSLACWCLKRQRGAEQGS